MDENEKRLLEIKQKAAWSSKQKENERALAKRREDRKIVLKFAFLAAALLILAVYYFSNWTLLFGEKSSQKEWYEGGTLHDATIRQWLDATYDNKRATAGDWVTSVLGEDEVRNLNQLKQRADKTVECVDALTKPVREAYGQYQRLGRTGYFCIETLSQNGWQ